MKFNCIISNPPYIDPALKERLQKDISFEPAEALFAENNGTALIASIISGGKEHLEDTGVMIIEIGESMPAFVKKAGIEEGFDVSVMNDYGGLPRVAVFKML
ncbi:MAG: hypothetical protein LBT84_03755 [Spirochaetia bacterium]|jgi:release factor glutamine methyltransferase|nr:hypothetical protein [Spirochaetia bacterium]